MRLCTLLSNSLGGGELEEHGAKWVSSFPADKHTFQILLSCAKRIWDCLIRKTEGFTELRIWLLKLLRSTYIATPFGSTRSMKPTAFHGIGCLTPKPSTSANTSLSMVLSRW